MFEAKVGELESQGARVLQQAGEMAPEHLNPSCACETFRPGWRRARWRSDFARSVLSSRARNKATGI